MDEAILLLLIVVLSFIIGLFCGCCIMYYIILKDIDNSDLDYETKTKVLDIIES